MKREREFQRVYAARRRASDERLLVFAAANALGQTRFGVSVSRKVGPAVRRSRLKRLLREAFRLSRHELPAGLDLILIPGRTQTPATLADYRQSLVELVGRLARRSDRHPAR